MLPYGLRRIQAIRTLTTESTAVLIPFRAQEIMQTGGIYYGQNAVSKNMIAVSYTHLDVYKRQEDGGAAPYDYTHAKDAADDLDYSPDQYEDFELLEPEDFLKP